MYDVYVVYLEEKLTLRKCHQENKMVDYFGYVRYATKITFQQSNGSTGNIAERKLYFTGKDSLYRYKVELSVLSTGLATGCSLYYPGSVADI